MCICLWYTYMCIYIIYQLFVCIIISDQIFFYMILYDDTWWCMIMHCMIIHDHARSYTIQSVEIWLYWEALDRCCRPEPWTRHASNADSRWRHVASRVPETKYVINQLFRHTLSGQLVWLERSRSESLGFPGCLLAVSSDPWELPADWHFWYMSWLIFNILNNDSPWTNMERTYFTVSAYAWLYRCWYVRLDSQ